MVDVRSHNRTVADRWMGFRHLLAAPRTCQISLRPMYLLRVQGL